MTNLHLVAVVRGMHVRLFNELINYTYYCGVFHVCTRQVWSSWPGKRLHWHLMGQSCNWSLQIRRGNWCRVGILFVALSVLVNYVDHLNFRWKIWSCEYSGSLYCRHIPSIREVPLALAEKPSLPSFTCFLRPENIQCKQVHTKESSHQGEDPLCRVAHCRRKVTAG